MPSALTRARLVSDKPLDLDKHRGMAAQKATDIRRILADVENNAKDLRDRQGILENQLLSAPAASWPEAAAKARYVLNLYAAGLAPADTHHRDRLQPYLRTLPGSPTRAERMLSSKEFASLLEVSRGDARRDIPQLHWERLVALGYALRRLGVLGLMEAGIRRLAAGNDRTHLLLR